MSVWIKNNEKSNYNLRLKFERDIDPEVKRACKEFARWLRKEYYFPKKVYVYFKSSETITALDEEKVSATFWSPYDKNQQSYAKVATGDYDKMLKKRGKDNALASILHSVAHELTHYFQWLKDIEDSEVKIEKQAKRCADLIIDKYACTREHP